MVNKTASRNFFLLFPVLCLLFLPHTPQAFAQEEEELIYLEAMGEDEGTEESFDFEESTASDTSLERTPAAEPEALSDEPDRVSLKPRKIRHPLSKKGLVRITKEKEYIYKVPTSEQRHAASIRFGVFDPTELKNPDSNTRFSDNYSDTSSPILFFDYEWQIWKMALGKLGLKAGSGLFYANGTGQFKNDYQENADKEPKEVFTFLALPNSIGAIYRAHFWDRQPLVPYADGGFMAFTFAELRDDGGQPRFGLSTAGYAAGGLSLNLTSFEKTAGITLDREYGINSVFLTAEFKSIVGLGGNYDFSANVINAGVTLEY